MTVINKYYTLSILNSKNEYVQFSDGSFKLTHGTEYKVMLTNNHPSCRANAKVYIDGKRVGHFRVETNSNIIIERPDDDKKARKLTFFDINSEEGRAGGLTRSSELGNIRIEIQKETEVEDDYCCSGLVTDGIGGTALGKESKQKFYKASHIEVDPEVYTLNARMVLIEDPVVIPL
jgi:hypothetical protein